MPSAFPRAPKLLKGALVAIDTRNQPTVIAFQYNPATLTRKLEVQSVADGGGPSVEVQRLVGAPVETINLEAELDATDGLEAGDATTEALGVHPQLAALEALVYPRSDDIVAAQQLMDAGGMEIAPTEGPMTLFVWGTRRVLPVRITEFGITEEAFDANLNPIRAKVTLGLRVLSYNDLSSAHAGNALFLAHQVAKESMAAGATTNSLDAVGGSALKLG